MVWEQDGSRLAAFAHRRVESRDCGINGVAPHSVLQLARWRIWRVGSQNRLGDAASRDAHDPGVLVPGSRHHVADPIYLPSRLRRRNGATRTLTAPATNARRSTIESPHPPAPAPTGEPEGQSVAFGNPTANTMQSSPLVILVECPVPVVSSRTRTLPVGNRRTVPSPAVIWNSPRTVMKICRRGAGCGASPRQAGGPPTQKLPSVGRNGAECSGSAGGTAKPGASSASRSSKRETPPSSVNNLV